MKIRHPLEILNDKGRYFISRWSDILQQNIKLSGFFTSREKAEKALNTWKRAQQLEEEASHRN